MHHRRDGVQLQGPGQKSRVVKVSSDQRSPTHRPLVTARQVVIDDRLISRRGERLAGVAADIAGTARDKDRSPFLRSHQLFTLTVRG